MMLYYYTGFEYALDDILNHHLKVATLDSINDPNEWVFCCILKYLKCAGLAFKTENCFTFPHLTTPFTLKQ